MDALTKFLEERALREKKFPLKSLLLLYLKHQRFLYLNYFENFILLVNWLGPIDLNVYTSKPFLPLLYGYDIQEIANILKCHPAIIQHTLLEIYNGD